MISKVIRIDFISGFMKMSAKVIKNPLGLNFLLTTPFPLISKEGVYSRMFCPHPEGWG